jgi:hypothetical protein
MNKRILSVILATLMMLAGGVYAEKKQENEMEEPLLIAPAPEDEVETDEKTMEIIMKIGDKLMILDSDVVVELDVPPTIINDRTMLPLRAIFEALGAMVSWEEETKTVFAIKGDTVIAMQIGQDVMYVGGDRIELDSPSVIVEDRTLVPVRAVAEALGNKVEYDEETKTVTITN